MNIHKNPNLEEKSQQSFEDSFKNLRILNLRGFNNSENPKEKFSDFEIFGIFENWKWFLKHET